MTMTTSIPASRLAHLLGLCLLSACAGKEGAETGTTATTGTTSDAATTEPATDGTTTAATTTDATTTAPTTTEPTTTDVAPTTSTGTTEILDGTTEPDPCASTCGSSEECFVDDDASTGVGGDDCDEGFHCVVTMDCGCTNSFCEADCDPNDAASCRAGQICDPNTGLCT